MDDYFNPQKSIPILEKAQAKLKTSFTAALILALAKSQAAMDTNGCDVWKILQKVRALKKYHHKDTKSRRITKWINFASGKKSCPFVSWCLGGKFYSFSAVSKC